MEEVIGFFQHIIDSMNNFADNSDSFWERIILWLTITYFEIKLTVIEFSYSIASSFLDAVNISQLISQYWSSLDSSILGALSYLRIPEALNIILSALATRFVMDLLPI